MEEQINEIKQRLEKLGMRRSINPKRMFYSANCEPNDDVRELASLIGIELVKAQPSDFQLITHFLSDEEKAKFRYYKAQVESIIHPNRQPQAQTEMVPQGWVKRSELNRLYGVSRQTLINWARSGKIDKYWDAGKREWLHPAEQVIRLIKMNKL